ncbi:MAG TPA: hypothetical protein VM364_00855 [Vicinamibacterales bacterium]|nr:hypothetical protein [Vicinamibacterales bacterium]
MYNRLRRLYNELFAPPRRRRRVPADELEELFETHTAPELLEELFAFGQLMLDEVAGRTVVIEGKATSVLGWTTALLALFVLQPPTPLAALSLTEAVLTALGVSGAIAALIASALALRVQDWDWPSQQDWLRSAIFDDPTLLRQYHIVSMLETHEAHACVNEKKARALKFAQAGLILAGLCLGLQLVAALVFQWWTAPPPG